MTATDCTCPGHGVGLRVMIARLTGDSPHQDGCPLRDAPVVTSPEGTP